MGKRKLNPQKIFKRAEQMFYTTFGQIFPAWRFNLVDRISLRRRRKQS
ncbi:hypothetical protein KW797_01260 [Candidatus Parcubacteria bacterium]|nr:hypothetical protein [Candidatus Parcubacteria bacterium]